MAQTHEYDMQRCEKCGAAMSTKRHLVWLCDKLGPLAYTNPSLLLAKSGDLLEGPSDGSSAAPHQAQTSDFMRILCPKCKYELNIRL